MNASYYPGTVPRFLEILAIIMALVALLPEVGAIIASLVALSLELLELVMDCMRPFLEVLAVIMDSVDPLLYIIYCGLVPGNPSHYHGFVGRSQNS